GALANWPRPATTYAYGPAPEATTEAVRLTGEACDRYGLSLAAAAIQFSTRHADVTSTAIGATTASHLEGVVAADQLAIPDSLWDELEQLVPSTASWKEPPGSSWPPAPHTTIL